MILGIEMLVTVAVIGYFGYHYGSILLAGFKSAKASISSQTPVQDPGYPIDVDGQAPTNQVQADTEVVTEEVFKPTSAKLVAVGDNLMHRSCTLSAKNADGTYDFTKHFANMADIFKAADLAVISQDTVLGGIELGATSTETGIFNTAVELADGMADAGINVVLAANNHIMDEGSAGLNTMMSYFSTKYPDITLLGVNNSREAKDEPVYVETNNIKIAMINYSYGSNQTADLDASPYLLNQYDEDWLSDILKQARDEDDFIIAKGLQKHFEKYHYDVQYIEDFEHVLDEFLEFQPDLVLLDIHLPFFDGYYWCQEIRKISQVPIVFISSANENMNIVLAMNMGGDDFINKPFDLQVVQAKLQAILRRTYSFSKDFHLLTYQDVHLDILAGKITYQQKELILTKNELKILEYLFEHAEVIVSRIDLMNHLWDDHQFIDDNTLSVNMNRLRKKLEDIGLHDFIHTKKGLGYLLCLKTI